MVTDRQRYYLQQMGIMLWELRTKQYVMDDELAALERSVSNCTRCVLHKDRTQTVFARGNSKASLMIIGEAPGFHEDKQGLPFVGRAGGLLNNMLSSIQLSDNDVYIANVLKCRPPENRDPNSEEITQCSTHLTQQITLIKPKLILAVGRFAGQFLLNKSIPMNKMRQQPHQFQGIPVVVSYHPAYLLRNPREKKYAYQDLLQVKALLHRV